MDVFTKDKRSEIMSHIKNKNTKPEKIVRSILHRNGFRYSLHSQKLPGSPDIVLTKYKTVIFVNGCFWHGHTCKKGTTLPQNNSEYWISKLNRNKKRDQENYRKLEKLGWNCIIVWTCELTSKEKIKKTMIDVILRVERNA